MQDLGRPGHAHLGVPRSGALDEPAHRLANRLLHNPDGAATLETTFTGCAIRALAPTVAVVTGAPCPVTVDGRPAPWGVPVRLVSGAVLEAGPATHGVRSYLGFTGGVDATPVLGSRATDLLSDTGPAPLRDGDRLGPGTPGLPHGSTHGEAHEAGHGPDTEPDTSGASGEPGAARAAEVARAAEARGAARVPGMREEPAMREEPGVQEEPEAWEAPGAHPAPEVCAAPWQAPPRELVLPVTYGPRADWFTPDALRTLTQAEYRTSTDGNRIGLRLEGPRLERTRDGELPSEGMVLGAVQVPPSGRPVVFLADHPVTGGYPVIGVVSEPALAAAAQAVPGTPVRFVPAP